MDAPENRTELFERFSRHSMVALLFLALVLGGAGLSVALSPPGAINPNLPWWLLPIVLAMFVFLFAAVGRRRFRPNSPEVQTAMADEWRQMNLARAARVALLVVLIGQWPLALIMGFLTHPQLTPPRVAIAMAEATFTLGVATTVLLFLYFDRES